MQAYEFYAIPQNGVLSIPEPYKSKIVSTVKVILLEQNASISNGIESDLRKRTDLLSPISIDTLGWTFDKEDANER